MRRRLIYTIWLMSAFFAVGQTVYSAEAGKTVLPGTDIPMKEVGYHRLPDMTTPRSDHEVQIVNGEITVFGGVTTGFKRLSTAEYLSEGQWHEVPMLYHHSSGTSLILSTGEVMVGGGSAEDFGIGQTWGVEKYTQITHSFEPMPIFDQKRALCSSAQLSDGTIVVSGNWYEDDEIEIYRNKDIFEFVKNPLVQRSSPLIFPVSEDNAIIFSFVDNYGDAIDPVADRLYGDPLTIPLFEEAGPGVRMAGGSPKMANYFVGNASKGDYSYIIPVILPNEELRMVLLRGEEFSFIETDQPFPKSIGGQQLNYLTHSVFVADPKREKLYLDYLSTSEDALGVTHYIMCVDYKAAMTGGKASLSVLKTEIAEEDCGSGPILVLPDGNLVLVGGGKPGINYSYEPLSSVFVLEINGTAQPVPQKSSRAWIFIALALLAAAGAATYFLTREKKEEKPSGTSLPDDQTEADKELIARISALMEETEIFRRQNLKIIDVAKQLGTNVTYVSSCINRLHGGSFNDFINRYRVKYAKQWLLDNPGKKVSEAGESAGFSSEASFYRNFKALAGCTPLEWLSNHNSAEKN